MTEDGALILVATPIGNLGDLSARAIETLRTADIVAAEDTRRTRGLLSAAGVPAGNRLRAVHAHNERAEAAKIVEEIRNGRTVAYVSDAGMPGIADNSGAGRRMDDARRRSLDERRRRFVCAIGSQRRAHPSQRRGEERPGHGQGQ